MEVKIGGQELTNRPSSPESSKSSAPLPSLHPQIKGKYINTSQYLWILDDELTLCPCYDYIGRQGNNLLHFP